MLVPMGNEDAERLTGYGANLAGALVGAAAGAALGGPPGAAVGAMLGEGLTAALAEVSHRLLSHREQQRVGAVALLARQALIDRLGNGAQLRRDSFLRERLDGRSPADEVIEHVLLVAQRSYEERKLPHIAEALASIATAPHVDEHTANWVISALDRLSWPKLVGLALVAENETNPLPDAEVGTGLDAWGPWSAHRLFVELHHSDQLIGRATRTREKGLPDFNDYFNDYRLTSAGRLIYQCAGLDTIPADDKDRMRAVLNRT